MTDTPAVSSPGWLARASRLAGEPVVLDEQCPHDDHRCTTCADRCERSWAAAAALHAP